MAKKDKSLAASGQQMPQTQKDDALFEALGQSKKRKKRRIIITVISILLVLAVIAVITVSSLQRKVRLEFATSSGEVLSHTVATGTISTLVSGSGSLTDVDLTSVTVPEGVEITEVLVKTNDTVAVGDLLATVEMASVVSAMADLQAEIEELDEQISDAEGDKASTSITAGVSGRVKAIYAEAGDDVADAMVAHGALALVSLDGYMAVDIATDVLSTGDSVTVLLADGEEITGTVETAVGSTATILVTDNGPEFDETVTILDETGTRLGSGQLYVHSPLRVTAYAGTVKNVRTSLNTKVSAATTLFTLADTSYSANYNSLLRSRSEKEETLLELLTIQHNGAVLSDMEGSVYSVDYTEDGTAIATLSADETMSVTISVDESDILSLALGQEVTVTVNSVSEDAFAGTLTEINRTSSSSGIYSAVVELPKAEGMLSGMTASVSVQIEGVENAILVPIDAVYKTRDGAYVYTSYDEELQEYGGRVDVTTGLENSTYVEIKSGLNVGDTVYYTESGSSIFDMFGGMGMASGSITPGNMGGMPDMGNMPDFSGGQMPDFGGGSGGGRPDFGGSGMPGGFGG